MARSSPKPNMQFISIPNSTSDHNPILNPYAV